MHGFIAEARNEAPQAASRGIERDHRQRASDGPRHPQKHASVRHIVTEDETELTERVRVMEYAKVADQIIPTATRILTK